MGIGCRAGEMVRRRFVIIALLVAGMLAYAASSADARVWRVGTWNGVGGQFTSIQAAVNAARPGDWILVGPGDYKEQGYPGQVQPAGVLITTPNIHLRGMNRSTVVVDGTRPGAAQCSSQPTAQGI